MHPLTRRDFLDSGTMSGFAVRCDNCHGAGYDERGNLCPKCEGDGLVYIRVRKVRKSNLYVLAAVALVAIVVGGVFLFR